jgi:hypothetical protein
MKLFAGEFTVFFDLLYDKDLLNLIIYFEFNVTVVAHIMHILGILIHLNRII